VVPFRPSPENVTTPEEGVLEAVPDRATELEDSETVTVAEESVTAFPEMSLKVTTGTVVIPARFTAPEAEVVRTI
jgi:hypothetical protein